MTNIILRNVQYQPNQPAVALFCEHPMAPFFLNTTQSAMTARANGGVWGDAEALAEAQAGVDAKWPGQGFVVVLPASP